MNAWNEADVKSNSSNIYIRTNNNISSNQDRLNENYLIGVGSRTARFKRRRFEVIIIFILLLLILILAIIVVVISIYYSVERGKRICQSEQCVRSAANLLMSMDTTVDPCEDFYKYACGNWANDRFKPDYMSSYNLFSEKQENINKLIKNILTTNSSGNEPLPLIQSKSMYKACMDTETIDSLGMQPVIDFMESVGLPPIPNLFNVTKDNNYYSYQLDWVDTITKIKKRTEFDMLLGFDVIFNFSNTSQKILAFGQPSSTMLFPGFKNANEILKLVKLSKFNQIKRANKDEDDDIITDKEKNETDKEIMKLYLLLMKTAVKETIKSIPEDDRLELSDDVIDSNIDTILNDYIKLYKEINAIIENITYTHDDEIEYKTVFTLQEQTNKALKKINLKSIDVWKRYILQIFANTNVTINFNTDLVMMSKTEIEMVHQLITVIQNTTQVRIEMFLWLQLLENFIPHTTTTVRDIFNKFISEAIGTETSSTRSSFCAETVNEIMGMAVAYAIINSTDQESTIKQANVMLKNIKTALEDIIVSANWMDTSTKMVTVEKIHTMKTLVGFPDWLLDHEILGLYYANVTVDLEKHLVNQIGLRELSFLEKISGFREPQVFGWSTFPTEANAFHTYSANTITIPYAVLQYPFFNLGLEALNYGAIGAVLGHELTHGIDNNGRGYDKFGNQIMWWSNKTINNYLENSQCLIKQFSEFYIPEVNGYVDGNLTLDENIADNGGLKSALKAYRMAEKGVEALPGLNHLNGDQLFFLSHGNLWCSITTKTSLKYSLKDSHSPNHLRINGNLQNSPEFAEAWNCPKKSKMNPSKDKCIMF